MVIRALSVTDGLVYHCWCPDPSNPCKPRLEVDARTLPGDLDSGPLLVTVADWSTFAGIDAARACLPELRRKGRVVSHLGVPHITFPTWLHVAEDERAG
jgi:hypothetical protein